MSAPSSWRGIIFLCGREIAGVFVQIRRRLRHRAPPFIQRLFHAGQIVQAKLRAGEPVPGSIIVRLRFQMTPRQISRALVVLFVQGLAQFGPQRFFLL